MLWFHRIGRRLAVLIHRDRWERDLEEEMTNHLAMQAEDNRAGGMDPGRARSAAARQFGNAALLQEDSRDSWGWGPLERFGRDLRYGFRNLRNNPGFAAVAILSLALGIGANTAVFTVVNAVLLRSLAVHDPRQLIILGSSTGGPLKGLWKMNSYDRVDEKTGRRLYTTFPMAALRDFRAQASNVADLFGFFSPGRTILTDGSVSRDARVTAVTGNFFDGIAVPMALGRGLTENDDRPGAGVIVVTHDFWRHALGGESTILGKVVRLNGIPMAVVGVTGPGFHGVSAAGFDGPADLFAPLGVLDEIAPRQFGPRKPKTAPDLWWLQIMGRRKPGVTVEAAATHLTSVYRGTLEASGIPAMRDASNPRIVLTPGDKGLDTLRDKIQQPLLILSAAVALVLLLACVNLACLQLARSAARRREIAVRLSLGAGRGRIIRQLLIESLLLASCGAAAGAALAVMGAPLIAGILTTGPQFDRVWLDLTPDLRILAFAVVTTGLTGVLFGLSPALQATRVDIASNLKSNRDTGARVRAVPLGKLLIAVQAALSLVLLAGSGLFLRTLANLYSLNTGFAAADRLLLFRLDGGQAALRPEQSAAVFDTVLDAIATTPGVRSAAAMSHLPIGGWRNSTALSSPETDWNAVDTLMNTVSPGYFETVGMPIVAGRSFAPRDSMSSRPLAILNQTAARRLCGNQPAVGRILRRHAASTTFPIEVIGVARDAKFESLRKPVEPTVFLLFTSAYPFAGRAFAVRTDRDPLAVVSAVRQSVSTVKSDMVMLDVKTERRLIDEGLHQERLFASILTLFGGFALLLAAIGLHGVTAYSTARRTPEIGLRIALGASTARVVALVLRQMLLPVAAGILAGMVATAIATRWVETFLFGVKQLDALTFGTALGLLVVVAAAAAFVPARRAARVDPVAALRAG